MPSSFNHSFAFNDFRFDIEKRVLWRGEQVVALPPKATEVLSVLLTEPGSLIERQEILERVWADTYVEEGNLNHAISSLRRALGADLIQTVPKRGYRFSGEVSRIQSPPDEVLFFEKRSVSTSTIDQFVEFENLPVSEKATRLGSIRIRATAGVAASLVFAAAVGFYFFRSSPVPAAGRPVGLKSIAVLPLKSFAPTVEEGELSMRITDALITKLGEFGELVVRPTNAVLPFAGKADDVVEIGRKLSVDSVLDGRVQQEGGRLRITLQLLCVADGTQLWAEQFDGRVGETLALQDLIAERLGKDLALVSSNATAVQPKPNNDSYEAYLKGRFLWNQRKKETYYKALEYFERSVQLDPSFALGYAGIADTYHLLHQRNAISTMDAFEKAEAAARKAYELDPNLAEANTSMGDVSHIRYAEWHEAEGFYHRAIGINPNLAEPYARLGMLYNGWGRFDEARSVLSKAVELDPTSINNAIYLGANYYFSKQFDKAVDQFERILEFSPGTERAHFFLTRIYELEGKYDKAVEHALKEREISRPQTVGALRQSYGSHDIRKFWNKQVALLEEESKELFATEHHIASRYVLLGEHERAIEYVEKNLKNLGSMRIYGQVDPMFEKLRNHERFIAAMSKTAPPPV